MRVWGVDYNGFLRGFYWIVSTERGLVEEDIRKRVFWVRGVFYRDKTTGTVIVVIEGQSERDGVSS